MMKFIKNLVKWYGILTVGLWTWVGCSHVCDKLADNPNSTPMDVDTEIINETCERYKKFFKMVIK